MDVDKKREIGKNNDYKCRLRDEIVERIKNNP